MRKNIFRLGVLSVLILFVVSLIFAGVSVSQTTNVDEIIQSAKQLLKAKKVDEAIAKYKEVLQIDPQNIKGLYGLSYAYYDKELFDESMKEAQKVIDMNVDKVGKEMMSKVLTIYAGSRGLKANRGSLIDKITHGPAVRNDLIKALQYDPKNYEAHYGLGIYYLVAPKIVGGNIEKAITEFKKSIDLESTYAPAYFYLARAYKATNQIEKAKEVFAKSLDLDPNYEPALKFKEENKW